MPLLAAVVATLVPEPVVEDPIPVLVGRVVSVPFAPAVVVGKLAEPVGGLVIPIEDRVLEISMVVGALPVPDNTLERPRLVWVPPLRILESILPRLVESEVAAESPESVGVGVTRAPVDAEALEVVKPRSEERKFGSEVDEGVADGSTPVLGPVMPAETAVEEANRLLISDETGSAGVEEAVADDAAEESTPVVGPVIPAFDDGVEESLVEVGTRAVDKSDITLLRLMRSLAEVDEEAGAVEAAVPEPDMPDLALSLVKSELSAELAVELDEVTTPPGPNVIPLPVEVAADDGFVSVSLATDDVVGRTMTDGIPPLDAAGAGSNALERND